jgi:hypothetical protein
LIDNVSIRAGTLLNDDFFKDVVEKQRQVYINNILNSPDDAIDLREKQLLKLRGLEEFIASLQSLAANTEIEKKRSWLFNL